jgi:hypothetical protein
LATSYFHVVFTVPHELNGLALENPRLFYDLLFTASAQTLLEIALDRKHLGAEIGVISILHTWGQNLLLHPHIHCAIPAGGLSPDHRQWVRPRYPFFLPVKVLSRVFRGKFLAGSETSPPPQLSSAVPVRPLPPRSTAVHKPRPTPAPPRLGRLCQARLRWTHAGVALSRPLTPSRGHSNHRLLAFDQERHLPLEGLRTAASKRKMTLAATEFLRRFFCTCSQRVRAHPSLRIPRQSLARFSLGTIATTAVPQLPNACPSGDAPSFL